MRRSRKSESVGEEFKVMETINRLGQPLHVLMVMAIATTGMSIPAIAGTDITSSQESLQLAQASLIGQCRAVKQPLPVFKTANPTSEALRLLAADERVTLASNSVDINGFISISEPIVGFVNAINLKPCNSSTVPPSNQSLCRQIVRPPQGLVIRRAPSITATEVGGIPYLGLVTLTANPATLKRADDRDWVEISAPVRGWVSKGLVTEQKSNLAYCK